MITGFELGRAPVFEPPRRKMHIALPGIAPSLKVAGGWVRTRSPLMLDGMIHLETNPMVSRICPYPIKIEYASSQTSELFKFRDHTFDLGVEMRDGQRVYIDYEPFAIQQERAWFKERTERLREVAQFELGADYQVHDERKVYIQPRFANLKIVYQHLRVKDDDALMVTRRVVAQMDLPTTIGAIRSQVKLKALRFEVTDLNGQNVVYGRDLNAVDRAFTSIMQMAGRGEISLDLSRPLGDASLVCEAQRVGA